MAASTPAAATMIDQLLQATAQHTPPATATKLPDIETMAVDETMRPVNDDINFIKESPFPRATTPQLPKVSLLGEVHQCRGLVINFSGEEPISSDSNEEEI
uniref:Uncharacterized protein n=1 Tax=Romanomermis culicivorax TaxID=13658 RepID=A0A915IAM6_ROMCU